VPPSPVPENGVGGGRKEERCQRGFFSIKSGVRLSERKEQRPRKRPCSCFPGARHGKKRERGGKKGFGGGGARRGNRLGHKKRARVKRENGRIPLRKGKKKITEGLFSGIHAAGGRKKERKERRVNRGETLLAFTRDADGRKSKKACRRNGNVLRRVKKNAFWKSATMR